MYFHPEDVRRVAQSVIDNHVLFDQEYGKNSYNECRYCSGRVYWSEDANLIQHSLDCLVHVAGDLLTGIENGTHD